MNIPVIEVPIVVAGILVKNDIKGDVIEHLVSLSMKLRVSRHSLLKYSYVSFL